MRGQAQLGVCSRQPDHGLERAHGDGDRDLFLIRLRGELSESAVDTRGVANGILSDLRSLSGANERDILLEELTSDNLLSLLTCGEVFLEDSRALAVLLVVDVKLSLDNSLGIEVVD